jgi:catechol 2,3-dioxygenase-like lactoylglutathione lyase family enzyme
LIIYEALHHVSLIVTDLEKAKNFYSNILGLKEIPRPSFDFQGAWYEINNQQLHLIVYEGTQTLRENPFIDTRDGHFALRVKDYNNTVNWLQECGVELILRPQAVAGYSQIYCCDPDGNVIELNIDGIVHE